VIINDSPLDDRDAGILNLGGGRLLVTWFCHPTWLYLNNYLKSITTCNSPWENGIVLAHLASYNALPEEQKSGGSYISLSEDNGFTWSPAMRVPISSPHGPNLLSDGTIMYLGKELYALPGEERPGAVAAHASTDGGHTWKRLGEVPVPEDLADDNFHEPHVIELPSGRLLGVIRVQGKKKDSDTSLFTVYSTVSDDKGLTWSMPKPTGMVGSPPHLLLHSSGALICAVGRRTPPFGQRAYVSYDEGETWAKEYVLCDNGPGSDLGYPATVEISDGRLLTVYYQQYAPGEKCSLLQTIWSL
jgi:sialidase-1